MKLKYALSLTSEKRILHATFDGYAPSEWPRVDTLPEGDVTDYKYIDGQFVHDPLPEPEPELPAPPTPDTEARIKALEDELAATKILLGVE